MNDRIHFPFLSSYPSPLQGKVYLNISDIAQSNDVSETSKFPFLIISDSNPLFRLVEGGLLTDAGSELKKVFLLVQRDQYLLAKDELSPITNRDVDDYWQRAFSNYGAEKKNRFLTILSRQIDEQGNLKLLPSLFYCMKRQLFFHPPCPGCGEPLRLCDDDTLLAAVGLHTYSRTLKRYLFCPSCSPPEKAQFYVYEMDPSDPPTLKDRRSLIKDFGNLRGGREGTESFPCRDCGHHPECFGTDLHVFSRLVPFSFYPFRMLIFDAMSLNALDFIPLLSGAIFEELAAKLETEREFGRLHCIKNLKKDGYLEVPFLFPREDKLFLEIFFLKLSFLGEILQRLGSEELSRHRDLRLSIDRIWVNFPEGSRLLPSFWNFNVNILDITGTRKEPSSFEQYPSPGALQFFGALWFYTFLTNKRRDISNVYLSLSKLMNRFPTGKDVSPDHFLEEVSDPTLLPENIFWDPAGKIVNPAWAPLWGKALHIGWSLLRGNMQGFSERTQDSALGRLEELREEVKGKLFHEGFPDTGRFAPEEDQSKDNLAIRSILDRILAGWEREPAREPEAGELKETVILSPGSGKREVASPPVRREADQDAITETVILSPKVPREGVGGHTPTVPSKSREVAKEKILKPSGKDYLVETVILSPDKTRESRNKRDGTKK